MKTTAQCKFCEYVIISPTKLTNKDKEALHFHLMAKHLDKLADVDTTRRI